MGQEQRTVRYDRQLQIEAYRFSGIKQKFPNHFHEYYVIGFIESGSRHLSCKNCEYTVGEGDLVLFNPYENHQCEQIDGKTLDYRCLNITEDVMRRTVAEITGVSYLPSFQNTVIFRNEQVTLLRELHQMIMDGRKEFEKEEIFYFLIGQLIDEFTDNKPEYLQPETAEVQRACRYLEEHYQEVISLNQLGEIAGQNKYTLLRNFTRQKGITPYQYLETIRVGEAKKLLESGEDPIDAALLAGYADQSHFTKNFKKFIGLTPRQYKNIFLEN